MMGLYEGILGVKRDYKGLRISPCFPAGWERAEVTRSFRNAQYHVVIQNPKKLENGVPVISIDGTPVQGNLLPDFRDGKVHQVEVVLKEK